MKISAKRFLAMLMAVCTLLSMACVGFGAQMVRAAVDTSVMPQLQLDVEQSVSVDGSMSEAYCAFTPEKDGYYLFYASSPQGAVANLYNDEMMYVAGGNGTSYGGVNFGCTLTGGTTYVLGVRSWEYQKATLTVQVKPSPVQSITVQPLSLYEGTSGYVSSYWDNERFESVSYYRYNWYSYLRYTVNFLDGTQAEGYGSGFYYGDNWLSISTSDQQGEAQQWLPGNTYTGTVSAMGATAPVEITIEESPVAALEMDPILMRENDDGYMSSSYNPSTGTYEDYFRYNWYYSMSGTVVFKDGQRIRLEGQGLTYQDRWYNVSYQDTQSSQNPMLAGNTYAQKVSILGVDADVLVSIVSPITTKDFEYVVQDGMAVITDCFMTEEDLKVPETIDGYPVVGINTLGDATLHATEITVPDSVTMLGGMAFAPKDWHPEGIPVKVLNLGSGVSSLSVNMLDQCKALERIVISAKNPNYCSLDGVVYDKGCTRMVAFPPAKKDTHVVPDSVTDVSIIFEYAELYINASVQMGAGVEDYVTVDGVTFDKDMTTVIKCNPNLTGSYVMPESVKTIESYAFAGTNLTEITLSPAVTEIVYCAFLGSKALEKVNMPEGLKQIRELAFLNCTGLKTVEMPASVENVEWSAFSGCTGLRSVYITDLAAWCKTYFGNRTANPLSYARDLYLNGQLVKELVIPETVVEKVYANTFYNGSMTKVTVPATVKAIGSSAFNGASVQQLELTEGLQTIGSSAFANTDLEAVTLPNSLQELGGYAFQNCTALKTAQLGTGITRIYSETFANTALQTIVLPKNIESVGWMAFANATLTEVVFENDAIEIDYKAFMNCPLNAIELGDNVSYIGDQAFQGSHAYTVKVPDAVTEITYRAFAFNYNLVSVTLSENINYINENAFEGDGNLTHVLYTGTQEQWDQLDIYSPELQMATVHTDAKGNEITFNNNCTHIKYYCSVCDQHFAAKRVKSAHSFENETCTICGHSGMWDYTANADGKSVTVNGYLGEEKQITIPSTLNGMPVTAIGEGAFVGCKITSVTVPAGVTVIGSRAFDGCSQLTQVILPEGVVTIGSYAFRNCLGLESLCIPEGTKVIEEGAFTRAGFTSVQLPDSLESIGDSAFFRCEYLRTVQMPAQMKDIYGAAFAECYNLRSIRIPEGVTRVDPWSFRYCYRLEEITLPGTVTDICYDAFTYCESLESITIPESVKVIDYSAFWGCYDLDTVAFMGDAPEIDEWAFGDVSATAIYAADNTTWTEEKKIGYGGELTWVACDTPVITCQPFDVRENEDVEAVAVVMYSGKYTTVQWFKAAPGSNEFEPTGVFGNSYSLKMDDTTSGTRVYCEITNILGQKVTSDTVTLRMNPKVTDLEIVQLPYTLEYGLGQQLRTRGLEVMASYSDGTVKLVKDYEVSGYDAAKAGEQVISVTYGKFTAQFVVTVNGQQVNFNEEREKVEVNAPVGALDSDAQLKVEQVSLKDTLPQLPAEIADQKVAAFDISFEKDGQPLQPEKAVEVSIPVPEDMQAKRCKVYHISDDGVAVDMKAHYHDGRMVFTAEHFSYYAVVEAAGVTLSGKITAPSGSTAPIEVRLLCGGEILETQNAVDGAYAFKDLTPNTYTVEVYQEGLPTKRQEIVVDTANAELDLALGLTGDLDGNETVDEDDAIYLLQHVLMPEAFQVSQAVDYDGSGNVDEDDAIYLLQHVLMPESFPLK